MIFSPGKGIRDAEQGEFPLAGEYLIPKGTQLAVNIVAMNRDLGIWGEDADVFNPSRMEALKPEHDVIAFSLGSRNCVGKNFAWMEIRYVVANLLTSFEVFKLQDKMQDLSESAHFTLKLKSDSYLVHIRRRTIDK